MTDLISRIETILTEKVHPSERIYSFTNFSEEQIVEALRAHLPRPQNAREQEVLQALANKRYSRCKIYSQLVDENAFVEAVILIVDVLEAAQLKSSTLPAYFRLCAEKISDAQRQAVLAREEDVKVGDGIAEATTARLEKLAIDVFAKGLGEEEEQAEQPLLSAA